MCFKGPGTKKVVWLLWAFNVLVSAVYLGISMVTFHNVKNGVSYLRNFENREAFKNSLLASCLLGFLVVLCWVVFSFFVLLGRFFSNLPLGYGVLLGSCSHTGFFVLLAGLVLQTHQNLAEAFHSAGIWSNSDLQTYIATFSFNYILCGTYLLMFVVLLFTAGTMTEKEERGTSYSFKEAKGAPAASTSAAAPPAQAVEMPSNHGFGTNWQHGYNGGNV